MMSCRQLQMLCCDSVQDACGGCIRRAPEARPHSPPHSQRLHNAHQADLSQWVSAQTPARQMARVRCLHKAPAVLQMSIAALHCELQ